MKNLFKIFQTSFCYLKDSVKKQFMPKLLEFTQKRFELVNEREIKDLDRDLVAQLMHEAKELFLKYFQKNIIIQISERLELDLALKFLKSPYLEKKLKGINEIKEISE